MFWLHHTACGILVPQPGIETASPALEVQSLKHWTIRDASPFLTLDSSGGAHGQCSLSLRMGDNPQLIQAIQTSPQPSRMSLGDVPGSVFCESLLKELSYIKVLPSLPVISVKHLSAQMPWSPIL